MLVHRALQFGLMAVALSAAFKVAGQSWQMNHRHGLLDTTGTSSPISECTAILISSRKQCSNCGKASHDLMEMCKKRGYALVAARVVDAGWQTCKEDELAFMTFFPEGKFIYINGMEVQVQLEDESGWQHFNFDTTPALLLLNDGAFHLLKAEELTDDYGRLILSPKTIERCKVRR